MDRLTFLRFVSGAVVSSFLRSANAVGLGSPQVVESSSSDDDAYAIWSLVIALLQPTAQSYLIPSMTTVFSVTTEERSVPPLTAVERAKRGGQLIEVDVPEAMQVEFREAVANQRAASGQVMILEGKLQLPHPYRLLSQKQLDEYGRLVPPACVIDPRHSWHRDKALERRYVGFSAPCRFSRVYFDRSRSLGFVLAGAGVQDGPWTTWIYIFRKDGDGWQLLHWHASSVAVFC